MKFYPLTIELLNHIIISRFGPQEPKRDRGNIPSHLIWMMEHMQTFPDNRKGSAKAGRWIGWIFREMERGGLIDEARILSELKQDVENGNC